MKKFLLVLMIFAVCVFAQLSFEKEEKSEVVETSSETLEMLDKAVKIEIIEDKNVAGVYLDKAVKIEIIEDKNVAGVYLSEQAVLETSSETTTY